MSYQDSRGISRRHFLAKSGAAAAGLTIISRAKAEQTPPRILVGSGEHTYEVIHDWITPPTHIRFG